MANRKCNNKRVSVHKIWLCMRENFERVKLFSNRCSAHNAERRNDTVCVFLFSCSIATNTWLQWTEFENFSVAKYPCWFAHTHRVNRANDKTTFSSFCNFNENETLIGLLFHTENCTHFMLFYKWRKLHVFRRIDDNLISFLTWRKWKMHIYFSWSTASRAKSCN